MSVMRAIVLDHFGGYDALVIKEIPEPEPQAGTVVVQVKAFGLNHAELHMRRGEWAEAAPVSGIECVGVVKSCPSGEFKPGQKVAAFMGGMGRVINGSYAQYTRVPVTNVVAFESNLPWEELAAIPESYATSWTFLFRNLEIKAGQTLLVRGGTSALGQAAIKMAVAAGARVIATSRSKDRFSLLEKLGIQRAEIEKEKMSEWLPESGKLDAVLDLVGNSVVVDSLRLVRRGGRVCLGGWLGGLDPIVDFNPLLQMKSGVFLTFFGSPHFGLPEYPISDVPLGDIYADIEAGKYDAKPSKVFKFDEIREAHEYLEMNQAAGKVVVVVE
ncbi:hypothetical protein BOTBODRAFT_65706 [Botryobasidium botryosum FD-172 SS1]|uniref:Enoyl reductase (ER) domain-containing protein n=1 Tax=Botryobasidium botryosum (strain FD-172 SS1) TaxID=930990 RepID=A0A067MHP1_BOTB1|nr:hypothetical protein BOTBODRAFT_65706 [Botryobasidium botryosum FD-172 SS1]